MGEADYLDTIVHKSPTKEKNTASPRIEEERIESIFSKIVKESKSRKRMNLANSLGIESTKLVHFGHPPNETNNVGNLLDIIVAIRIDTSKGIWRRMERDNSIAHTNDVETMSETKAYRNHIKHLEIETRNVFEREMSNKKLENIVTQIDKTRLDKNQMTRSVNSLKHSKMYELRSNMDP